MNRYTLFSVLLAGFFTGCGDSYSPSMDVDVRLEVSRGDYEQAVEHLTEALVRAPRDPDLLFNLAVVQRLQGNIDSAYRTAQQALDHAPADDSLLLLLAEIALEQNEVAQASAYLNRVSSEGRSNARAQFVQAMVEIQRNNWLQAEAALRTAIQLDDTDLASQAALGFVLIRQERPEEGRLFLNPILESPELSVDTIQQLVECYLLLEEPDRALALAERLNAEQHNQASLWTLLARAQSAAGRMEEAERSFMRAMVMEDMTPWHRVQYAEMLFADSRYDEALAEAKKAESELQQLQMPMRDPSLYNLLATLYAQRGQVLLAHRFLYQSLSVNANQPQVQSLIQQFQQDSTPRLTPIPTLEP